MSSSESLELESESVSRSIPTFVVFASKSSSSNSALSKPRRTAVVGGEEVLRLAIGIHFLMRACKDVGIPL